MALDLTAQWRASLGQLRTARTPKRLRASLDGELVLDTRDALLVWEPGRVVPQYAVPQEDFSLELTEVSGTTPPERIPPVLAPGHFDWHTTPGSAVGLAGHADLGEVAFRPDGADLGGRVVVDFARFAWVEEDQPVVETFLPVRWYLPAEDVRMDLLSPSDTHTTCAYKGVASYLSVRTTDAADGDRGRDIAWFYPDPLHEAEPVKGLVAFWSERAEVLVDGQPQRGSMPQPSA